MTFFHMSVLVIFYSFLEIFQIIQQFLILTIFIFGSMENWGTLLLPNFGHLGNTFKKLVDGIIFYYDSTYKIRKKIFFEGIFPPRQNYMSSYKSNLYLGSFLYLNFHISSTCSNFFQPFTSVPFSVSFCLFFLPTKCFSICNSITNYLLYLLMLCGVFEII